MPDLGSLRQTARMNGFAKAADALVRERFPEAVAALLGGSVARGQATATSDLDVVVIRREGAAVYRETLDRQGRPAEVFVHTAESLRTMFAWDRANGVPTMASLCADALVLLDLDGSAGRVQGWARETIAAGPRPASAAALAVQRYAVTDLLDDLLDRDDPDERLTVAAQLHLQAAELLLTADGQWRGKGKWLPRHLRASHPELGGGLLAAYRTLAAGGPPTDYAAAVTAVLTHCGGPLREGDHRPATPALLAGPPAP